MENQQPEQVTKCEVCKQASDDNLLVRCSTCGKAYHTYCMSGCECCGKVPNRQFKRVMEVPTEAWYCKHCRGRIPSLPEGQTELSIMYGWGNNNSGCLSSGLDRTLIKTPTLLNDVSGAALQDIAVGDEISVVVDQSGNLYTCGNGTNGDLGHSDIVHESLDHFRRVEYFQSSKISKGEGPITRVFCRGENVFALSRNGHLYGWGANMKGELGHMDYKVKRLPKKNSAFREMNVQVKEVAMGNQHTLVLGDDNVVYAMGENTHRQLGVSNNSLEWTPKRLCQEWKHDRTVVKEPDFPGPVTRIFAGGNTSFCVDRKGAWYVWGSDILRVNPPAQESQVSFVSNHSFIPYPIRTSLFDEYDVKDLAIGLSHVLLLDQKGNVFAAGDNAKGQLGVPVGSFTSIFQKVDVPEGMEGVFALDGISGCYGAEGVFMWGDGTTNLIPGVDGNATSPKKIGDFKNVKQVKISNTHVVVLCGAAEKEERKREHEPEEQDSKKAEVEA